MLIPLALSEFIGDTHTLEQRLRSHLDHFSLCSLDIESMSQKVTRLRSLLPSLETSLKSFTSSSSPFQVIRTVTPPKNASSDAESVEPEVPSSPKTLFILDSSYNPPSCAHLALASTAIATTKEAEPYRLLFLFSTHNADKAPSPASFTQRLAMMIMCAEDLQADARHTSKVSIDIGLTTAPYYTDKSLAIMNMKPLVYASNPTHVHLLGYDTLTRFLAPKYYKEYDPPLSAVAPFFDAGHKLLVLLRPDSSSDNAVTGDSEEEQRKYIADLAQGSLASQGLKQQWASQIAILEGERVSEAAGISSTVIRKAAKQHDWSAVSQMCTPGVAEWIKDQSLYASDSSGAKMA